MRAGLKGVRLAAALVAVAAGTLVSSTAAVAGPVAGPADTAQARPVAVWEGSLAGTHNTAPDATVRQIAKISVPSSSLRVRFGNPFGSAPVVLREAWLGRTIAPGSPAILAGTNRRITFGGSGSLTLAPGQSRLSDPVAVTVPAGQDVAISMYAPGSPVNDAFFPPYAADPPALFIGTGGNTASTESAAGFPFFPVLPAETGSPGPQPTATGYHPGVNWWADLVVADQAEARGAVVTLGDSITNGHDAVGPPGQRWTDVLAERLNTLPAARRLAVANAGISGNTVTDEPNPYDPTGFCCGPAAPRRLDRDVLDLPGVRSVILLEGTNDIFGGDFAPPASATAMINAITSIGARVHARGLRFIGATIPPFCLTAGGPQEQSRLDVNNWMRSNPPGVFDGVLDFDALLRDPADPTIIRPALQHDCVHPNAAGDAILGASIPLDLL